MGIGAVIAVAFLVLRIVLMVMRASEDRVPPPQDYAPPPGPRMKPKLVQPVRLEGVPVDVVREAKGATVRAPWAFGGGPKFELRRAKAPAEGEAPKKGVSLVGKDGAFALTTKADAAARAVLTPKVLEALGKLPASAVVRATEERVELVMKSGTEASLPDAQRVVTSIASFGLDALKETVGRIGGADVIEMKGTSPAHARVPTPSGVANLDLDLGEGGLTATLALETKVKTSHAAEIDLDGSMLTGDQAWIDQVAKRRRRDIGPAKLTLDDGWVEIVWTVVPTTDQLLRATELLASLAAGRVAG